MAAGNHDQENVTNAVTEQDTRSAIETVLSNTEQSYEEFMSCFVGLKKEDVVAHQAHQLQKTLRKQENDPTKGQRSDEGTDELEDPKPSRNDSVKDEIETEELREGHSAPTQSKTDLPAGHRFIQMDNFVDDAELLRDDPGANDDDEEFASSKYESSFGVLDSSTTSPLKLSKDLMERIEGADDNRDTSSGGHPVPERGCEMRTLPGEAEEEDGKMGGRALSLPDDAVHRTELNMSTRRSHDFAPTEADLEPGTSLQVSSDDVKPFSLDTDFDYDNVVLTPKWDSNHRPPGWMPGQ